MGKRIEMKKGMQAASLLASVDRYWPGTREEKRLRLLGVLNRLLDEKVLEHLHRKYQGKSWEGLTELFTDLENLPAYEQQEAQARQVEEGFGKQKNIKAA